MARISTTEANQALVTTNWSWVSLHSADPSTTGASELAGGGYARVAVAWNAASGGSITNSGALSITVPASTTTGYFGIWSASTAGTYMVGGTLGTPVTTGGTSGVCSIAAGALTVTAS